MPVSRSAAVSGGNRDDVFVGNTCRRTFVAVSGPVAEHPLSMLCKLPFSEVCRRYGTA